jgi:rSAM-associated Gly-rich repeat protein
MSTVNRRECLKDLLSALVQTAGTVVVASAVLPARAAAAHSSNDSEAPATDLLQRADQLAQNQTSESQSAEEEVAKFVNGGFRNAAFRNAGGGGGEFRNGGFANGGGGGGAFRNGGFANGGWRNI